MTPRTTAVLAAAMAVGTGTQFLLGALSPQFADDLGLGPGGLGVVLSAMFAVGAASAGPLGRVVDRAGAPAALGWTGTAAALALGALAAAPSRPWLAATVVAGGAAMAIVNPATNLAIRRTAPPRTRGRSVGWVQAGVQGGALVWGLVAATAAVLGSWRSAAAVGAAVAVGVGLVARRLPDGTVDRETARPMDAGERSDVRRLAVFAVLMSTASGAVFAHLPLFAAQDLGLSAVAAGALPVAFGGAGAVARVAAGYVVDRILGPVRLLRAMAVGATLAVGLVLSATWLGPGIVWLGALLFGLTGVAWPAVAMALVVRRVGGAAVGDGSGLVARGLFTGLLVAPAAGGWLAESTGSYRVTWAAVGAALSVAVAWSWVALRPDPSPAAEPSPRPRTVG